MHKKHLCQPKGGWFHLLQLKLWKSNFSGAIHHWVYSDTEHTTWLSILVIKCVLLYAIFCHKSALWMSCSHQILLHTLYLWQIVSCYSPHFLHVPSCCLSYLDASLIPQPCTPLFVSLPLSTDSLYLTQRPIPSHRQESETSDDWD